MAAGDAAFKAILGDTTAEPGDAAFNALVPQQQPSFAERARSLLTGGLTEAGKDVGEFIRQAAPLAVGGAPNPAQFAVPLATHAGYKATGAPEPESVRRGAAGAGMVAGLGTSAIPFAGPTGSAAFDAIIGGALGGLQGYGTQAAFELRAPSAHEAAITTVVNGLLGAVTHGLGRLRPATVELTPEAGISPAFEKSVETRVGAAPVTPKVPPLIPEGPAAPAPEKPAEMGTGLRGLYGKIARDTGGWLNRDRNARLGWAQAITGRDIQSFSELTPLEIEKLMAAPMPAKTEITPQATAVARLEDEMSRHDYLLTAGNDARMEDIRKTIGIPPDQPLNSLEDLSEAQAAQATRALAARREAMSLQTPRTMGTMGGKSIADAIEAYRDQTDNMLGRWIAADTAPDAAMLETLMTKAATATKSAMMKLGVPGRMLALRMEGAGSRALYDGAQDVVDLAKVMSDLPKGSGALPYRQSIFDMLEGKRGPTSPLEQNIYDTWDRIRTTIAAEAERAGLMIKDPATGQRMPFMSRKDYVPHIYSEASIKAALTDPAQKAKILEAIERDFKVPPADVLNNLKRWSRFSAAPEVLDRHLQLSRLTDMPGFEKDPAKVLIPYVMRAWERIHYALEFGPEHEQASDLINLIGKQGGKGAKEIAERTYQAAVGFRPWLDDPNAARFIRDYRNFSMIQMLSPTAAMKHVSQVFNTLARTGVGPTLSAVGKYFSPNPVVRDMAREEASRMGAALRDLVPEAVNMDEVGRFGQFWARKVAWITPTVRANRMVASLAGSLHAEKTAADFAQSQTPRLARELGRLGLNPQDVLNQNGVLSPVQKRMAGMQVMNDTQLTSRVLDLPHLKNTQWGPAFYLFRSAAFQQTRALKEVVIRPLVEEGNYGPALRYLAATGISAPALGWAIDQVKAMKSGRAPKGYENPGMQYIMYALHSGALGVLSDGIEALGTKPPAEAGSRFVDLLGGVPLGDLARTGSVAAAAAQGNWREALDVGAAREIPLVGNLVGNTINPPKGKK